jgi:Family of unknown function (DUF6152)
MSVQRLIWVVVLFAVTGLLLKAGPAVAHHSSAPFYDATRKVEVQGPITKFLFRNPHSFLYLQSTDDKGQTAEWQVELGAAAPLTRTGWTPDTLKPGMVIKVVGQPSRAEGSRGLCCARLTRPDGTPVVPGGRVEEEAPPRR